MTPFDAALRRMRAICLALPDTKETPTWGEPHFRVGEKIFAGLGEKKGVVTIGFKLELDHADAMVRRPGFARAPYVGHKGWVSMDVTGENGLGRGPRADSAELQAHRAEEDGGVVAGRATAAHGAPDGTEAPGAGRAPEARRAPALRLRPWCV